jgi:hypothetical protein
VDKEPFTTFEDDRISYDYVIYERRDKIK